MITEERKKQLLLKINKLDAYTEIQNTMGRMIAAVNFRRKDDVYRYFASELEDVSLEYADEGVFTGPEAVRAGIAHLLGEEIKPGEMIDLQLTTPVIEVAGDCMSARAVWWSPGAASVLREGQDPQALWVWGDFAVDFVYIHEEWKIRHLHYFTLIKCDYHKGWVEDTSLINRPNTAMHPLAQPSTWHHPYHPKAVRFGIPAAPYPYDTDREEDRYWMLRNDKTR
ncbi:MAG: nuclear transport factor 2 family protein [Solobacterium sp.]|nr:nuclear transport factor 2 family protein [Solobacterium sp.]